VVDMWTKPTHKRLEAGDWRLQNEEELCTLHSSPNVKEVITLRKIICTIVLTHCLALTLIFFGHILYSNLPCVITVSVKHR
jgi:hypothetical protein